MNAGDYCCYKNNERNLKLARLHFRHCSCHWNHLCCLFIFHCWYLGAVIQICVKLCGAHWLCRVAACNMVSTWTWIYYFSGVVFLIEFSNEQHISIRNIDGCYFLAVKEQTFLMLKLKLVRFALTANTQYSHAVCAARNAQQARSHNCLGTHFISM